jgi:predicted DNA-binding ribbon-helix-helix protein
MRPYRGSPSIAKHGAGIPVHSGCATVAPVVTKLSHKGNCPGSRYVSRGLKSAPCFSIIGSGAVELAMRRLPIDKGCTMQHVPRRLLKALFGKGRTRNMIRVRSANTTIFKRCIVLHGRKTSVSLEDVFWNSLHEIAAREGMSPSELVAGIDRSRERHNLSSAIRLFVLHDYRRRALPAALPDTHRHHCMSRKTQSPRHEEH